MSYYGTRGTLTARVEDSNYNGVSLSSWGDSVEFSDEISTEDLKRFAQHAFAQAQRAQSTVEQYVNTVEQQARNARHLATIFGEHAKQAAIAQQWCNEYEEWREKIADALTASAFYSESSAFREASERRTRYNVVVEVLANNESAAYDWRYAVEQAMQGQHAYGVSIQSFGDVTLVVPEQDDDDNDDDSDNPLLDDDTY